MLAVAPQIAFVVMHMHLVALLTNHIQLNYCFCIERYIVRYLRVHLASNLIQSKWLGMLV